MKKYILTTLLLACSLLIYSQHITKVYYNKNWKTVKATDTVAYYRLVKLDSKCKALDTIRDYYADGKLYCKTDGAQFVDTLNDKNTVYTGTGTEYYKTGPRKSQILRNDRGIILSNMGWHTNGKLRYTVPYVNGKKEGLGKTYQEGGSLLSDQPYINDMKNGIKKSYTANGAIYAEATYVDDKLNGISKSYYSSGELKEVATYLNDTIIGISKYYYKDGKLEAELPHAHGKMDGTYKTYYENGNLSAECNYVDGKLNGTTLVYWDNKLLKRRDVYENGKLTEGKCYDITGKEEPYYDYYVEGPSDDDFTIVQQMPQFKGDINSYLSKNIKYPKKEQKNNITGTVYINFIIEKDGSISSVRVLRGVPSGPDLDDEALRVISSMPRWTPGLQDGFAVRVSYNVPIRFTLQ